MDNEVYESQLDIDISPFQRAIQKATSIFKGLETTLDEKHELQIEINNLEGYINEMTREFLKLDEALSLGKGTTEMQMQWEFLKDRIDKNKEALRLLKDELNQVSSASDNTTQSAIKMPKIFKQMAMAVIGVRSVYSGFHKIISASLSQNAELSNKFSAIWQALGNAITPILQRVANAILTLFSYLNIFIKVLTGGKVDILGSAMATANKNTKATTGSLKEMNKQLAGFDELNNIDENTGSGSSGGGGASLGIADAFADVKLDTTWADRIQAFGEWMNEYWPSVVMGVAGFFTAMNFGATKMQSLGVGLLLGGIWLVLKGMYDILNNGDWTKGLTEIAIGIGMITIAVSILKGTFTAGFGILVALITYLAVMIIQNWDKIKEDTLRVLGNVKQAFIDIVDAMIYQWEGFKTTISNIIQAIKDWVVNKWNEIKQAWNTMVENIVTKWDNFKTNVVNKVEDIKTGIKNKIDSIKQYWTTLVDTVSTKWANLKTNIVNKFEEVKTSIKDKINGIIGFFEGLANRGVQAINKIITSLNRVKFNIPSWVPVIGGKNFGFNLSQVSQITLPRLDTGTNYVPNDMLAQIHKGEAVIPKKFNSDEYFGSNQELLDKLDQFMEIVEGIDLQPYVDITDVSQKVSKYQNQQVRIMGGAY